VNRALRLFISAVLCLPLALAAGLSARPDSPRTNSPFLHVPTNLEKFQKKGKGSGMIAGEFLDRMGDDTVYSRVILKFDSAPSPRDLDSLGIIRLFGRPEYFSVFIPSTNLGKLASRFPGLTRIQPSLRPHPDSVTGEEIELFQATNFTKLGYDGGGVKVAVIDGGFSRIDEAVSDGDLPPDYTAINYSSAPSFDFDDGPDSMHGTAVAEIIHDVAPGAGLTLIRIDDFSSLLEASDYCALHGIRVINHSMGWFLDGWNESESDIVKYVVAPAFRTNILWVNSAGNSAQDHFQSFFVDADFDGRLDFGVGTNRCTVRNASLGDSIDLFLDWNGFTDFADDNGLWANYDIYLFNWLNQQVTNARTVQPFSGPFESIHYVVGTVNPAESGDFTFEIRRTAGTKNYDLQVFSASHALRPRVESSSVLTPADSVSALAVGAIASSNWARTNSSVEIEFYSSRGPSKAGVVKPDICGIDNMTNFIYGRFPGTSAAAPSVVGLAALILSKQPYLTSDQLKWIFMDNAEDVGPAGKDNTFGSGKARLDLFPVRRNADKLSDSVIVAPTRLAGDRLLYYYGVSDGTVIRLRTLDGSIVKEYEPRPGPYATGANFLDLSGVDLPDSVYLLEFSAKGQASVYRKIIIVN